MNHAAFVSGFSKEALSAADLAITLASTGTGALAGVGLGKTLPTRIAGGALGALLAAGNLGVARHRAYVKGSKDPDLKRLSKELGISRTELRRSV